VVDIGVCEPRYLGSLGGPRQNAVPFGHLAAEKSPWGWQWKCDTLELSQPNSLGDAAGSNRLGRVFFSNLFGCPEGDHEAILDVDIISIASTSYLIPGLGWT
jgi:hypothetical protein